MTENGKAISLIGHSRAQKIMDSTVTRFVGLKTSSFALNFLFGSKLGKVLRCMHMQCRTGDFALRLSNCPGNNNNLNDERAVLSHLPLGKITIYLFHFRIMEVWVGVSERGRKWNNRPIGFDGNYPIVGCDHETFRPRSHTQW